MFNKVYLIGNLGRDPEVRSTASGMPVANFSLATHRRWSDREGNRQEQTEWHNIVCFGRQAEVAGQYLTRGRQVFVEGRIQTRSWDDRQTGEKRYRTEIVSENFQMLGPRTDRGEGSGYQGGGYQDQSSYEPAPGPPAYEPPGNAPAPGAPAAGVDAGTEPEDDDIPF